MPTSGRVRGDGKAFVRTRGDTVLAGCSPSRSSAFATFFERLEHHLRVLFHFLLQNRSDELGEGGHAKIIIDPKHDLRHPIALREGPRALELVEIGKHTSE